MNIKKQHAAAWLLTCNLFLKGILPGVHLDKFDAVENLIHRANTAVCYQHGFPSELVSELGKENLRAEKAITIKYELKQAAKEQKVFI